MKHKSIHFSWVITGRRALQFAERCVHSIGWQQGDFSYDWLYVDDASGYRCFEKDKLSHLMKGRVLFLEKRHFQVRAIARGVAEIKDRYAIVCLIDGDDYVLGDALLEVAKAYQNPNIVMTYGNALVDFRPYQNLQLSYFFDKHTVNTEYPKKVWESGRFRQDGFRCFHLRTFRRWLWDYIDLSTFCREDQTPIRASGDSAFLFPMLELLGEKKHVAFIETPIYVYRLHPGNVHHTDKESQSNDLDYIRFHLKPFAPLNRFLLKHHLDGAFKTCAE